MLTSPRGAREPGGLAAGQRKVTGIRLAARTTVVRIARLAPTHRRAPAEADGHFYCKEFGASTVRVDAGYLRIGDLRWNDTDSILGLVHLTLWHPADPGLDHPMGWRPAYPGLGHPMGWRPAHPRRGHPMAWHPELACNQPCVGREIPSSFTAGEVTPIGLALRRCLTRRLGRVVARVRASLRVARCCPNCLARLPRFASASSRCVAAGHRCGMVRVRTCGVPAPYTRARPYPSLASALEVTRRAGLALRREMPLVGGVSRVNQQRMRCSSSHALAITTP